MTAAITIWRIIISVGFFVGGMYLFEVDNRVQKLEREQTKLRSKIERGRL